VTNLGADVRRTILQSASRVVTGAPAATVVTPIETQQDVDFPHYDNLDVELVNTLNDFDYAARYHIFRYLRP
jgi:hypothetical protein